MRFDICQGFKGAFTAKDFLTSEGTLLFTIDKKDMGTGGGIFQIIDKEFIFLFDFNGQELLLRRNNVSSLVTLEEFEDDIPLTIFVMWNFNKLTIKCRQDEKIKTVSVPTTPTAPPATLINEVRKQNLIPNTEFKSEEEFRQKICSCLQSIQEKINETNGALSSFWDYERGDNGKITKRTPKRETNAQAIVQCLLSDQMLMSSIDLVPQYETGEGNLDFMFIGNIKDKGLSKVCAEFKNAHSRDLEHGLMIQLPTYMRNKNSKYGFYCVLNYKGEWFDQPNFDDSFKIDLELSKKQLASTDPIQEDIRLMVYDLGKQKSASKK